MILVDTSVWIDHLRQGDHRLVRLLNSGQVLVHAAVVGEIALGRLASRGSVLGLLAGLPQATDASHAEVMALIERRALMGLGIGYVDAHLLAATLLTGSGARLWTRDRRLDAAAATLGCEAQLP